MRASALAFLLAVALASPALAQSFVGDWTATAHTPGGDVSEKLSVAKAGDGYTVSAHLVGAEPGSPEAGQPTNVVVNGDNFSYTRSITTPQGSIEIDYKGVVSGDTFTGKAEVGGQQVDYNGVRIKESK